MVNSPSEESNFWNANDVASGVAGQSVVVSGIGVVKKGPMVSAKAGKAANDTAKAQMVKNLFAVI
ncbi:MAG: hypothetical protein WC496_00880 [Phycisphaerae bacterium]